MDEKIRAINSELTQMYKWEDDLYHRYGVFFGLSDPAVWILYGLYEDTKQVITQNDLVSTWFYPKQTINYTVSTLVKNGCRCRWYVCYVLYWRSASMRRWVC